MHPLHGIALPQVRPNYIVELDEHVFVGRSCRPTSRRLIGRSDLSVAQRKPDAALSASTSSTLTAPPAYAQLPVAVDIERLSSVILKDRRDRKHRHRDRASLSPSNKGSDRPQYLAKRHQYFSSGVSVVEIDLQCAAAVPPSFGGPWRLRLLRDGRPSAGISGAPASGRFTRADPLPQIPVPLKSGDAGRHLQVQEMLHKLYDSGGYEDYIYAGEPQPPLPCRKIPRAGQGSFVAN